MPRAGDVYTGRRQRRMRRALGATLPAPCNRCGLMVERGQAWHIDHVVAVAHGGGAGAVAVAHAWCNMSAGGHTRRIRNAAPSRQW